MEAKVKVNLTFDVDDATRNFARGVDSLVASKGLRLLLILRDAMSASLLAAYHARFTQKMPDMSATQKSSITPGKKRRLEKIWAKLRDLESRTAQRLAQIARAKVDAEDDGASPGEILRLDERSVRVRRTLARRTSILTARANRIAAGTLGSGGMRGALSTGQFRARMTEIRRLLSPAGLTAIPGKGFALGPMLENIRTPSFTENRTDGRPTRKTSSKFTVMWRQLEMGTGTFARPNQRTGTFPYKMGAEWWYGRTYLGQPDSGLRIAGTRGGHFLKTVAGLPYDADAVRFDYELGMRLHAALLGV